MIKTAVLTALNRQIQHEQSNAHAYQAVSLYFGRLNLRGLAAFMAKQVRDERMHAAKLMRHVADRGGAVDLGAIPAPKANFESPLEAVKSVRDLERTTTETIHRLYELACKESDYAAEVLLHWYVTEQVEEEKWADELTAQMQQFHASPGDVFTLDQQWGRRAKRS
jgi:ferritin